MSPIKNDIYFYSGIIATLSNNLKKDTQHYYDTIIKCGLTKSKTFTNGINIIPALNTVRTFKDKKGIIFITENHLEFLANKYTYNFIQSDDYTGEIEIEHLNTIRNSIRTLNINKLKNSVFILTSTTEIIFLYKIKEFQYGQSLFILIG